MSEDRWNMSALLDHAHLHSAPLALVQLVSRAYLVDPVRTDRDLRELDLADLARELQTDHQVGRLAANLAALEPRPEPAAPPAPDPRALPCPCCGQLSLSVGIRLNEVASARAALWDAAERLRDVPKTQIEKLQHAHEAVEAAQRRLAELEEKPYE